jgi:hypothetical protein
LPSPEIRSNDRSTVKNVDENLSYSLTNDESSVKQRMLGPYEIDLTETDIIPQALQNVSDCDENNSAPVPPMFDESRELCDTSLDDTKLGSRET